MQVQHWALETYSLCLPTPTYMKHTDWSSKRWKWLNASYSLALLGDEAWLSHHTPWRRSWIPAQLHCPACVFRSLYTHLGGSLEEEKNYCRELDYMVLTPFVALETERNSSPACCPLRPVFPTPQISREIIKPSNRSFQIMSHGLVSLCYREPGSLWNTLLILAVLTPRAVIKKQVTWLICLRNYHSMCILRTTYVKGASNICCLISVYMNMHSFPSTMLLSFEKLSSSTYSSSINTCYTELNKNTNKSEHSYRVPNMGQTLY